MLEAAGSRYTYAANPLAMAEAERRGLKRLALVGMSCQASINGTLQARRVNKYARRIELTLGLLCSKSFAYDGMRQVIAGDHGIPLTSSGRRARPNRAWSHSTSQSRNRGQAGCRCRSPAGRARSRRPRSTARR